MVEYGHVQSKHQHQNPPNKENKAMFRLFVNQRWWSEVYRNRRKILLKKLDMDHCVAKKTKGWKTIFNFIIFKPFF